MAIYKGLTPIKRGDSVYLLAYDKDAKVKDVLASQFTVHLNKSTRFFFYSDKGVTCRISDE